MNILITGITGFVGSHLADELHRQGHVIYGLARSQNKVDEFQVPGIILYGDLSQESIQKWSKKLPEKLDVIVHTAGLVHSYNTQDFYAINTHSTFDLQKTLQEKYADLHFIFISSLAASKAVSDYGKSKKNAEDGLKKKIPGNWKYHIVRPPMVIGPRDPAILDIFKMVHDGIVLFPGLNASQKTYSYINVFDLVHILVLLIKNPCQKELLNVSYPEPIFFSQIISEVKKAMNKKAINLKIPFPVILLVSKLLNTLNRFIPMQARLTPDKTYELKEMSWVSNGAEISKIFNYKYQYDFNSSVQMTLSDYKKRGWI